MASISCGKGSGFSKIKNKPCQKETSPVEIIKRERSIKSQQREIKISNSRSLKQKHCDEYEEYDQMIYQDIFYQDEIDDKRHQKEHDENQ